MTPLIALPLIATWTVIFGGVVGIPALLIWGACKVATDQPDYEEEAEIEEWLEGLLVDFRAEAGDAR